MNERIKALADQALKACDAAGERGIEQYSARFAELIVRDCAKFVYKAQPDTLALDLLSHYGIIA